MTNHRAGEGDLFVSDDDRYLLLRLLGHASRRHGVVIAAWCLMGNHFHLVLNCPHGQLSAFMHSVESPYARTFNARHRRRGPLFIGRFHNTVITSDAQLLLATRYCLRNPLELGIDITTYPWSSYVPSIGESWQSDLTKVDATLPVELAGGTGAFRKFVESDYGFDRFALSAGRRRVHASPYRSVDESLAALCEIVATVTGRPTADLIEPIGSARRRARFVAILLAHDCGVGSPDEIQDFFKLRARSTLRSAIRAATTRAEVEPQFKALVEQARFSWVASTQSTAA